MFERFIGSKLEHSDPAVRAKAYASGSIDEDTLSKALASESDPQVLCVVLTKSMDVSAILRHAHRDSQIADAARHRLLELAAEPADSAAETWQALYTRAAGEQWGEFQQLLSQVRPDSGFENLSLGALKALASNSSATISQSALQNMAQSCQSSVVRQEAAKFIVDPQVLEDTCQELKDKDKSTYRILKKRLDEHKDLEALRARAVLLMKTCAELAPWPIQAQPESVASATAKAQKLEEQINELRGHPHNLTEISALMQQFDTVWPTFSERLASARTAVNERRRLLSDLEQLGADTAADSAASLSSIEKMRRTWEELPDSTATQTKNFDELCARLSQMFRDRQHSHEVCQQLAQQLETWEQATSPKDPEKTLGHYQSKWQAAEKPRDDTLLAPLHQRFAALCERIHLQVEQHRQKREHNSTKLLAMLAEFKASMSNGDLKQATSSRDKLSHRLNTEVLDGRVRGQVDAELKAAQPQLDEHRKWRHFGTQQARETLIGEANKILSDPPASPKQVADQIKALREAWRKLDQDDGRSSAAQWESFSAVCKEAYKPAKKHFKELSKERKSNEKIKREIIGTLDDLLKNTDWDNPDWEQVNATDRAARLAWTKSGVVDFKVKKELDKQYDSISSSIDAAMRDEKEREVRRREIMIAKLKSELEHNDIKIVARTAKDMQRAWRPTVQAERKIEQQLWKEFRAICDNVFSQLKGASQAEKEIWQSDADERRKACETMNNLLTGDEPFDERQVNVAKGQADDLTSTWAQRSTIPKAIFSKLDHQFTQAKKGFQQRMRTARRLHERQKQEHQEKLAMICQRAEQSAVSEAADSGQRDELQSQWQALCESTAGATGKVLTTRFERALRAIGGDESLRDEIRTEFESNLQERLGLCLLGELIVDLPSPADLAGERMKLQVDRLKNAMQGGAAEKRQEMKDLIAKWYSLGGVSAEHWPALHERFERICKNAGDL